GQQIGPAMRHEGSVTGALLSKDERRILSWSSDNTLRIWDAATGQQIGPAMRHENSVEGALLSKDERRILSWSSDNTLRSVEAARCGDRPAARSRHATRGCGRGRAAEQGRTPHPVVVI